MRGQTSQPDRHNIPPYETKRTYLRLRRNGVTTKQNCANGYHRRE